MTWPKFVHFLLHLFIIGKCIFFPLSLLPFIFCVLFISFANFAILFFRFVQCPEGYSKWLFILFSSSRSHSSRAAFAKTCVREFTLDFALSRNRVPEWKPEIYTSIEHTNTCRSFVSILERNLFVFWMRSADFVVNFIYKFALMRNVFSLPLFKMVSNILPQQIRNALSTNLIGCRRHRPPLMNRICFPLLVWFVIICERREHCDDISWFDRRENVCKVVFCSVSDETNCILSSMTVNIETEREQENRISSARRQNCMCILVKHHHIGTLRYVRPVDCFDIHWTQTDIWRPKNEGKKYSRLVGGEWNMLRKIPIANNDSSIDLRCPRYPIAVIMFLDCAFFSFSFL